MAVSSLPTTNIRLHGRIEDETLTTFYDQLARAREAHEPIVLELSTNGGTAEVGRRIASEIRLLQDYEGLKPIFFGKTTVYSAGVTIMSAFPRECRFLTSDCELLIHGRQLDRTLEVTGAVASSLPKVKALVAEMETALELEDENFENLIRGSNLSLDEVKQRSTSNWYLTAKQALDYRLVERLF